MDEFLHEARRADQMQIRDLAAAVERLEAERDRLREALLELHAAGIALVPHVGYVNAAVSVRWDEAMSAARDALNQQDRQEP